MLKNEGMKKRMGKKGKIRKTKHKKTKQNDKTKKPK